MKQVSHRCHLPHMVTRAKTTQATLIALTHSKAYIESYKITSERHDREIFDLIKYKTPLYRFVHT